MSAFDFGFDDVDLEGLDRHRAAPAHILEPLCMSIHTFQAQLTNLRINFRDLFEILSVTLGEFPNVYELHCNFGHAVHICPEYPQSLKPVARSRVHRGRKVHGDGTSFQACLEIYIKIDHPEIAKLDNKIYKVKCFSTTGKIQIPGGRLDSGEDCDHAIQVLINYLNQHSIGRDPEGNPAQISLLESKTAMKNYKTQLRLEDPDMDLSINKLSRYIKCIEDDTLDELEGEYVRPPFTIVASHNPDESPKTTFRFKVGPGTKSKDEGFRVEIFTNEKKINIGKINFKGTKSREQADLAYSFLEKVLRQNWSLFVEPKPKPIGA